MVRNVLLLTNVLQKNEKNVSVIGIAHQVNQHVMSEEKLRSLLSSMWTAYALVGVICFVAGLGVGFILGVYYGAYARSVDAVLRLVRDFLED